MLCSQCGNDVAEGSQACPSCGTQLAAGHATDTRFGPSAGVPSAAGGAGGSAAAAAPAFSFDLKRLTRSDQIVGGASLLLLIALFLPWFTASDGVYGGSVNGLWHGYMYIDLILALAIIAFLIIRAGFDVLPFRLPVAPEQALLAATGINLVLAVISFVFKPSGDGVVSVGWGIGAFIGLIAAVGAAAPLGLPFLRSRVGR